MSDLRARYSALPPIVKNLIIINAIMLLGTTVLQKSNIIDLDGVLGLFYWRSPFFRIWQPITHLFMHGGFMHLAFNMFALWMFGSTLEQLWGPKKFLIFYLICGLGAAACHMAWLAFEIEPLINQYGIAAVTASGHLSIPTVGASGAVFGLLFAMGYLFPNIQMMFIFPPVPIKLKYFVAIYAAIELFSGISNGAGDNVAHFAHLGGMVFAFILLKFWLRARPNQFR